MGFGNSGKKERWQGRAAVLDARAASGESLEDVLPGAVAGSGPAGSTAEGVVVPGRELRPWRYAAWRGMMMAVLVLALGVGLAAGPGQHGNLTTAVLWLAWFPLFIYFSVAAAGEVWCWGCCPLPALFR